MSVPLHWTDAGLPVGMHFVGRFGDEATLFRLAAQLEQAQPWAARMPGVGASVIVTRQASLVITSRTSDHRKYLTFDVSDE
jgi:amidase